MNNACKWSRLSGRLLTVVQKDGKAFVSAEIPGVDLTDMTSVLIKERMFERLL